MLPAHEWRFRGLDDRVDSLTAHHEHAADRAARPRSATHPHSTPWELAAHLTWSRPWEQYERRMRIFAVTETDAHLRLLASRGLVSEQRRTGADVDPRRPLTVAVAAWPAGSWRAPPRLGGTRLVCVDGPAGSGKTTFAGRLAAALGADAVVVHMDDLYAGWTLTGAVARLRAGVLRPLADGRPGRLPPLRLDGGALLPRPHAGPGRARAGRRGVRQQSPACSTRGRRCASGSRHPPPCALARGLARDGAAWNRSGGRWQAHRGGRVRPRGHPRPRRPADRRRRDDRRGDVVSARADPACASSHRQDTCPEHRRITMER